MKTPLLLMATALLCSCTLSSNSSNPSNSSKTTQLCLLLGSYSPADAEGIRLYDFDQETGEARYVCGLKGIANPSYLWSGHPDASTGLRHVAQRGVSVTITTSQ